MLSHSRKEKWHGCGSQEGGVCSVLEHETFNRRNIASSLSHEMRAECGVAIYRCMEADKSIMVVVLMNKRT